MTSDDSKPRAGIDSETALPPDVNPAGLPPREPFVLAHSPVPPSARPSATERQRQAASQAPGASAAASAFASTPETLLSPWDETPARERLVTNGTLDAWHTRAEAWEHEARHDPSDRRRAEGLVLAAECWALVGEQDRARRLVDEAALLAPTSDLAQLEQRQLAQAQADWPALLRGLELAATAGATPEARIHALHYAADVSRIVLDKPEAARRHLHHAGDVGSNDDRASLVALAEDLAAHSNAPRAVLPPDKWSTRLEPLRERLKALREPTSALNVADSLALRFRAAGQALSERRLDRAAQLVSSFTTTAELREPALWLSAALAAPSRDSRELAISCLTELLGTSTEASRAASALIARALEQGSATALEAALAHEQGGTLASGVARVTLHVLGDDPNSANELRELEASRGQEDDLEAALRLALDPTSKLGDTSPTGVAFDLGRAAADVTSVSELVAQGGVPANAGDELTELLAALRVEAALVERSPTRLADALGAWPGLADGQAPAVAFLRGVLYEQGNDAGRALDAHLEALADPLTHAAAASALVKLGTHAQAVAALRSLTDAASSPEIAALHRAHAAWLATEANASDAEALIEEAAQGSAGWPFATLLGERLARARADRPEIASWLSRERDHADPELGRALLLLREASESAATDPSAATLLFQEALTLVPKDLATRLLHENLDDTSAGDRATWREEVASLLLDSDLRRTLYEEAAILYEQAAEHEDAQRAALELSELSPSDNPLEAAFATSVAKRHEVFSEPSRSTRASAPPEMLPEDIRDPKWLGIALHLEWQALESGNLERLQEIGRALARRLPPEDARVPTFFSIVASQGQVEPSLAIEWLAPLIELPTPPLWALRYGLEYASDAGDLNVVLRACERLLEADLGLADRAALSYRAGRAALGLNRVEEARAFLVQTLKGSERHLGALAALVEIHVRLEDYRTAAELLMEQSEASTDDDRKIAALFQASGLFETRLGDKLASRAALERIVELDVTHAQAFGRLVKAYRELPAPLELLRLYQVRIDAEPSPEAKTHWEEQRNRVLGTDGGPRDMRTILEERLREAPDDLEALEGLASLALARGDAQTAEQSWIRIAKVAPGQPIQRKAYERLAQLYEQVSRNPERLIACYRELAGAHPSELGYWRKLVQACLASNQVVAALKAQTALVNHATDVPTKRTAVIQLSQMYEHHAGDAQRAEGSLEKARAAWPFAPDVAQALYVLYGRRGNAAQASDFLTSTREGALLALATGTADPDAIALIAEVARLRGEAELEAIYTEAHAAALGLEPPAALVPALGARAASQSVEGQLAPEALSSAMRQLVAGTGAALSSALPQPVDLEQASPVSDEALLARATTIGSAFGFRDLGLVVHKGLPRPCVVVSSEPAVVAITPRLVAASPKTQEYHLVRAMKLAACSAGAFDTADSENVLRAVRLMLERYGAGGSIDESAPIVVAGEMGDLATSLHVALVAALPRLDETLTDLAGQVATTSGEHLDTLPQEWQRLAARTAFVWLGSVRQALDAISFEEMENPIPASGEARWRWLVENPVAWDLVRFALGDAYPLVRTA